MAPVEDTAYVRVGRLDKKHVVDSRRWWEARVDGRSGKPVLGSSAQDST